MSQIFSQIEAEKLLKVWGPFREAIGVTSVRTKKDHARASVIVAQLLGMVGEDEGHPLADLLDYMSNLVLAYEANTVHIPEALPQDVLRFLMEQHGLSQSDLADCAPQGRISDILGGRRKISKDLAKAFSKRFDVPSGVFI